MMIFRLFSFWLFDLWFFSLLGFLAMFARVRGFHCFRFFFGGESGGFLLGGDLLAFGDDLKTLGTAEGSLIVGIVLTGKSVKSNGSDEGGH